MVIIVIYHADFFCRETCGLRSLAPVKGDKPSVNSLRECHLLESKGYTGKDTSYVGAVRNFARAKGPLRRLQTSISFMY